LTPSGEVEVIEIAVMAGAALYAACIVVMARA
jgi:hypothetical protein